VQSRCAVNKRFYTPPTPHFCAEFSHSALCTLHFALCELSHSALCAEFSHGLNLVSSEETRKIQFLHNEFGFIGGNQKKRHSHNEFGFLGGNHHSREKCSVATH
jgi:hypothetical protein